MCGATLWGSWLLLQVGKVGALPLPLILEGGGRGRAGCVRGGSVVFLVVCIVVSSVSVGRGPE